MGEKLSQTRQRFAVAWRASRSDASDAIGCGLLATTSASQQRERGTLQRLEFAVVFDEHSTSELEAVTHTRSGVVALKQKHFNGRRCNTIPENKKAGL